MSQDDVLKVVYASDVYGERGLRPMHAGDAGLDLRCAEPVRLMPHSFAFVDCGLRLQLPRQTFGAIRSRSGLARKLGVHVVDGTVDENFTGYLGVTLVNEDDVIHMFEPGERIAQLVVIPYVTPVVRAVEELDQNDERGDAGYGSTGLA